MDISTYKDYEIGLSAGYFTIEGVTGTFDTYKKAAEKIDRLVSAESKTGFPVKVVNSMLEVGKITSINREEGKVWFSHDDGRRSIEEITGYRRKPRFFAANEANLALVKKDEELTKQILKLESERSELDHSLTEPLTFGIKEGNK